MIQRWVPEIWLPEHYWFLPILHLSLAEFSIVSQLVEECKGLWTDAVASWGCCCWSRRKELRLTICSWTPFLRGGFCNTKWKPVWWLLKVEISATAWMVWKSYWGRNAGVSRFWCMKKLHRWRKKNYTTEPCCGGWSWGGNGWFETREEEKKKLGEGAAAASLGFCRAPSSFVIFFFLYM
jgi:hypothetical protein